MTMKKLEIQENNLCINVCKWRRNKLYNFKFKNEEDYFDIKGKSITKSLMKTPINGARLFSSFGMRKHLFLVIKCIEAQTLLLQVELLLWHLAQEQLQEQDGVEVVVIVKRLSIIQHETIYAHMKAFAKGIKEGKS